MDRRDFYVIDFQEALDNLSVISEINMQNPPRLGTIGGTRLVTDDGTFPEGTIQWLSGEGGGPILDVLDKTYHRIHQHLISLYENPETNWESKKTQDGIAIMMSLVGESAAKLDQFLHFCAGRDLHSKVSDRESFNGLQKFYLNRFQTRFKNKPSGDQAWSQEWVENEETPFMSGSGLKDFETVRRDKEYELFYIRSEEGKPYFDADLLRNIKVTVDLALSEGDTFEEDPLLKVRVMQDRDLQSSAQQILNACHSLIEEFFKINKKLKGNELAQALSQSICALLLAANSHNLLQNLVGKSCLQYFEDFLNFLRKGMETGEYHKWIAYPPDQDEKIASTLLHLTHELCRNFFFRMGGVKQEVIGLIHRTMRKGEEACPMTKPSLQKGESLWTRLLIDDEQLRARLAKFPNGPLFKILDLVREEREEDQIVPFDPISQGNLPFRLYQIQDKKKQIDILRFAAPISQSFINKVEIVDEFLGFLRALSSKLEKKKHLMINLHDRTSWRESARSRAMEQLQKRAEFNKQLYVVTLPKDTDFYYQTSEYLDANLASDFMQMLEQQVAFGEECGYFFPSTWKMEDIVHFTHQILPLIHTHFFEEKKSLTRRNREDFVEIFYQFFILKAIDHFAPDSMSFTCKDSIDIGTAQGAVFYGFCKLLQGSVFDKEDEDFFLWLFYTPALFIRERAIDPERLHRALSTLERCSIVLSLKRDKIILAFQELFHPGQLKALGAVHL